MVELAESSTQSHFKIVTPRFEPQLLRVLDFHLIIVIFAKRYIFNLSNIERNVQK